MSNESLSIETIQALILALCWLLNSRFWSGGRTTDALNQSSTSYCLPTVYFISLSNRRARTRSIQSSFANELDFECKIVLVENEE